MNDLWYIFIIACLWMASQEKSIKVMKTFSEPNRVKILKVLQQQLMCCEMPRLNHSNLNR